MVRDTATILGAAILAVVAFQLLGGSGSLGPSEPPFTDSDLVVASEEPSPPTFPDLPTVGPVLNPSINILATPTPVPFTTPAPPTPTPSPSPRPSPTPAHATLIVYVNVLADNGGTAVASDWTVKVTGASPSPATFKGSTDPGTKVRILAGKAYTVTTSTTTALGYTETRSADCSGKASAGATVTCTFLEDDPAPTPVPTPFVLPLPFPWQRRGRGLAWRLYARDPS